MERDRALPCAQVRTLWAEMMPKADSVRGQWERLPYGALEMLDALKATPLPRDAYHFVLEGYDGRDGGAPRGRGPSGRARGGRNARRARECQGRYGVDGRRAREMLIYRQILLTDRPWGGGHPMAAGGWAGRGACDSTQAQALLTRGRDALAAGHRALGVDAPERVEAFSPLEVVLGFVSLAHAWLRDLLAKRGIYLPDIPGLATALRGAGADADAEDRAPGDRGVGGGGPAWDGLQGAAVAAMAALHSMARQVLRPPARPPFHPRPLQPSNPPALQLTHPVPSLTLTGSLQRGFATRGSPHDMTARLPSDGSARRPVHRGRRTARVPAPGAVAGR